MNGTSPQVTRARFGSWILWTVIVSTRCGSVRVCLDQTCGDRCVAVKTLQHARSVIFQSRIKAMQQRQALLTNTHPNAVSVGLDPYPRLIESPTIRTFGVLAFSALGGAPQLGPRLLGDAAPTRHRSGSRTEHHNSAVRTWCTVDHRRAATTCLGVDRFIVSSAPGGLLSAARGLYARGGREPGCLRVFSRRATSCGHWPVIELAGAIKPCKIAKWCKKNRAQNELRTLLQ
jgi:hypothetical protein